jgi:hypothetical protein
MDQSTFGGLARGWSICTISVHRSLLEMRYQPSKDASISSTSYWILRRNTIPTIPAPAWPLMVPARVMVISRTHPVFSNIGRNPFARRRCYGGSNPKLRRLSAGHGGDIQTGEHQPAIWRVSNPPHPAIGRARLRHGFTSRPQSVAATARAHAVHG